MKVGCAPRLRFPEFEGEWPLSTLGSFFTFKNGVNADKSMYGKGRKFINVMDVIADHPILHDAIIGSVEISDQEFAKNEVIFGDILFQRSSETREEVGQSNFYLDNVSATFGGFVIRGRPTVSIESRFFDGLLKTAKVRKDMTSRSGGSTRYNIGQASLEAVSVYVAPTLLEQQKIADFLGAVDARVGLLKKRRDALRAYKKGMMQRLFSQKLRFTKLDGSRFPDWQSLPAHELFCSVSNKGHNGDLPILAATQDGGVIPRDQMEMEIQSSAASILSYKIVDVDDFVISLRSFQGGIEHSKYHGICSPAYTVLKSNLDIATGFYSRFFKTRDFIERLSSTVVGIRDGKQISFSAFSTLKLPYPHPEEQQKIADTLTALDAKIDAVSDQTHAMLRFKKGLLQQMFV